MKPTSVKFGKELTEQLKLRAEKEGLSVNAILNSLAEKYVKGEIIDAGTTFQGDPTTNCIFRLKRVNECPVRVEIAEMKKPKNVLLLLKFCGRCPYLKGEIQPRRAAAAGSGDPATTAEPPKEILWEESSHKFMCKNGCGTELFWFNSGTKEKPKWLPMERNPMNMNFAMQHYCQKGAKPAAPPVQHEGRPALPDIKVKCTQCTYSVALQFFSESSDPIYDTRGAMIRHVSREHGRGYLEPEEDINTELVTKGLK